MVERSRGRPVTRTSPGAWGGSTWFFLKGVEAVAGPPQRRYRKKGPPLFVTEEWELLKKLRTSSDYKRAKLVDSLTVQGIERTQLAAVQRICEDLKVVYTGKLAEELGRDPREVLLEAERGDPGAFKRKKVDAVVRSLDKFASHCGTGRSRLVESLGSKPDMTSSRMALSRTVRAIGPA